MRNLDQFKGCLIGGAAGDALGYAVEFLPAAYMFETYGERGITEYKLRGGVAEISDDTQMSLFTATGLLTGATCRKQNGGAGEYVDAVAASYRDWYRTQSERYPLPEGGRASWLANVPELFSCRAPGNTCLLALEQGGTGRIDEPINRSKGCGGIMRVAPIGIYFAGRGLPEAEIDLLGAQAAALTHGHELGYIPAAMLVHILQRITGRGESIAEAVESAMAAIPALFPHSEHMPELLSLMEQAVLLSREELDDLDAIRELGMGEVAEETLAIGVYCALKYADDFENAMIAAVNHDGDSDSTGAVAGNILGTSLGLEGIPQKFLDRLELKDLILEVAEDLYSDCPPSRTAPVWESKYRTMTYRRAELNSRP